MFDQITSKMQARSTALLLTIDGRMDAILTYWLFLAGFASAARIAMAPHSVSAAGFSTFVSYVLLVLSPFASTLLALRWFAAGDQQPQPTVRLARVGRWQPVGLEEARRHPLYGASGILVSLIVGMMLNVPVRAAEYMAATPPIAVAVPRWLSVLHLAMTFDVVVFTSLYMIASIAALRRVPLFPRLLVAIWFGDLAMQLITAQMVASTHVPGNVAVALQHLLIGNVKKVLISMALWLPYLMMSARVNVTYRLRVSA